MHVDNAYEELESGKLQNALQIVSKYIFKPFRESSNITAIANKVKNDYLLSHRSEKYVKE
jgi:hypothetical protein